MINWAQSKKQEGLYEFSYGRRDVDFYADTIAAVKKEAVIKKIEEYDICHRISFRTICCGVLNSLNYFAWYAQSGEEYDAQWIASMSSAYLSGMILSVTSKELPETIIQQMRKMRKKQSEEEQSEEEQSEEEKNQLVNQFINDLIKFTKKELKQYAEYIDFIEFAIKMYYKCTEAEEKALCCYAIANRGDVIIQMLNNELSNLKPGYKSWNISLGEAYDCDSFEVQIDELFLDDNNNSIQIANLLDLTLGDDPTIPLTENGLWFFSGKNGEKPFVYSSYFLGRDFIGVKNINENNMPIVYLDYIYNEYARIDGKQIKGGTNYKGNEDEIRE